MIKPLPKPKLYLILSSDELSNRPLLHIRPRCFSEICYFCFEKQIKYALLLQFHIYNWLLLIICFIYDNGYVPIVVTTIRHLILKLALFNQTWLVLTSNTTGGICWPFGSTWVHPGFCGSVFSFLCCVLLPVFILFVFFFCYGTVSLFST